MTKTARVTEKEQAAVSQERQRQRRVVRQQLIGAAVIFSLTYLLWEIGGISPPPQVALREVPAAEAVFPADLVHSQTALLGLERSGEEIVLEADAEEPISEVAIPAEPAPPLEAAVNSKDEAVTKTDSAEEPGAPETAAAPEFAVQIGAFSRPQRVQEIVAQLKQKDFTVQRQLISYNNQQLWRVQVAGYASREHAKRGQQELAALGYKDTRIISLSEPSSADRKVEIRQTVREE